MDSKYKHHILGFGWKHNDRPQPFLTLRTIASGEIQEVALSPGFQFNWQLSKSRYCPGISNGDTGELDPCQTDQLLTANYELCWECENKLGFKSAFFLGQKPNQRMAKYLATPHHIYLAYFPPHIIKVGTAVEHRKRVRLIEQDALYAAYIATTEGRDIQRIEKLLAKLAKLPTAVRSKHKFQYLGYRLRPFDAHQQLLSYFQSLKHHTETLPEAAHLYPQPEFIDHTANPFIFYPDSQQELNEIKEPAILTGIFRGLRGRYLCIESEDRIWLIDSRKINGKYFFASDANLSYDLQMSLL